MLPVYSASKRRQTVWQGMNVVAYDEEEKARVLRQTAITTGADASF